MDSDQKYDDTKLKEISEKNENTDEILRIHS